MENYIAFVYPRSPPDAAVVVTIGQYMSPRNVNEEYNAQRVGAGTLTA